MTKSGSSLWASERRNTIERNPQSEVVYIVLADYFRNRVVRLLHCIGADIGTYSSCASLNFRGFKTPNK